MAVHNGEQYLAEALDSVVAQTLSDFEVVVVDDASTDGTSAILDAYAGRDGRFVVLRNEENRKLAASLNRGLAACRAPLVARADADDVNLPRRFERQVAFLDRHPEVGVVGTAFHMVDPDGHHRSTKSYVTDHATIRARQLFMSSLLHPSVMFRADVVRSVGGYDEAYWTAQDSDLWTRLRDRTQFANLPDALVRYRTHGESILGTRGEAGRRLSVGVPQRALSELLQRSLSDDELDAVVTLYRGSPAMESDEVRLGLPLLVEVLDRVEKTEPAGAARFLRREAADSILRQIWSYGRLDRPAQRAVLASALKLDPRLLFTRRVFRALPDALFGPPRPRTVGGGSDTYTEARSR